MKKADPFYLSEAWRDIRISVLRRDRWRCVMCGAKVHHKGMARVDHITPRRQAPELALRMDNLRTLCPSCDNKRHIEKGHKGEEWGSTKTGQPRDPRHWWNSFDYQKARANDKED